MSVTVKPSDYVRVPLDEIKNPRKPGPLQVYKDFWWAVDAEQNVLLYKGKSPQCNKQKACVERFLCRNENTTPVLIDYAFLRFNISDYLP